MGCADQSKSVAILALGVLIAGCSQPPGVYVTPQHKDLGVIGKDSGVAVAEFKIVNGLNRPVEIKHIFPSCKCTTTELLENPIPAGSSTVFRATADLSHQKGNQDFAVTLLTDNSEFSEFRLSFSALVPVTGSSFRNFFIGSFYPDSSVDVELPTASFSQGLVELLDSERAAEDLNVSVRTVHESDGGAVLVLKGKTPHTAGKFSRHVRFRESIPGNPDLGVGTVDLELFGQVVARWDIKPEIYCGFLSLEHDGGIVSLNLKRKPSTESLMKAISKLSVKFTGDWISLRDYKASSEEIGIDLIIDAAKLKSLKAVETGATFIIEYHDGDSESYSSHIFAYIDP